MFQFLSSFQGFPGIFNPMYYSLNMSNSLLSYLTVPGMFFDQFARLCISKKLLKKKKKKEKQTIYNRSCMWTTKHNIYSLSFYRTSLLTLDLSPLQICFCSLSDNVLSPLNLTSFSQCFISSSQNTSVVCLIIFEVVQS